MNNKEVFPATEIRNKNGKVIAKYYSDSQTIEIKNKGVITNIKIVSKTPIKLEIE